MTLNEITDNIIQIARNNNVSESEHLSRYQVQLWINYYRALLIKQWIDKERILGDIDEMFVQTIEPIHLDKIETVPGKIVYVGDRELPKLIKFNKRVGVVAVKDMYGNLIQLGSQTKSKLQRYRKATCGDYIAWVKGNKIYVEGDSDRLEYISVDVIAENPTELIDCWTPDDEYPIPAAMIPTIIQMILERELHVMVAMPSDVTNNSQDNTQNRFSNRR